MKRRTMRNALCLLLACLLVMASAGCAGQNTNTRTVDLMQDVKDVRAEAAGPVEDRSAAAASDFALRLFRASYDPEKNTVLSPLSVLAALAMTANGAKGETLAEMEQSLGLSSDELNAFFGSWLQLLEEKDAAALRMADSVWFADGRGFTADRAFLQKNAEIYGAGVYAAPFDDSTLKAINSWVKEKTDGMIPEILDEIPETAVMYLVNALAFDAKWSEPYNKTQVREGAFTALNGAERSVEYLVSEESRYLESEKATGFVKPYEGGRYAFAALLPNEGVSLEELLASLDGPGLQKLLADASRDSVIAWLPKFEASYDSELSSRLKDMGMQLAFDEDFADFSGLGVCERGNICINRVLHKTFLSVTEQGTRAGAAAAVEMTNKSAPPMDLKRVILDRPFLFLLIDCETNLPFLIGVLTDPGAE